MKYMVVTAKHHEGFCLWDSACTDYTAPNTPAGRDLLRPMLDAFRDKGLRTGLYYSLLDWRHPDYTLDKCHPMRDDRAYAEGDRHRDLSRYASYMRRQVKELLTGYGDIDLLWFDFSVEPSGRFPGKGNEQWESEKLIALARSLRPDILINDRLGMRQDFSTPEQWQPEQWLHVDGRPVVWEACQTFSGSWGYHRDEQSWKSVDMLIRMLIETVSKGGNLLLNVGPTGRGEIDARAIERLEGIGEWMRYNSRAVYGCTQAPGAYAAPPDCRLTYNPETNRLYLHVFSWPFKYLRLPGMAGKVDYAQFLHDASEAPVVSHVSEKNHGALRDDSSGSDCVLALPVRKPRVCVPVIELFVKERRPPA
jgi:alpha-L-fucosidase